MLRAHLQDLKHSAPLFWSFHPSCLQGEGWEASLSAAVSVTVTSMLSWLRSSASAPFGGTSEDEAAADLAPSMLVINFCV